MSKEKWEEIFGKEPAAGYIFRSIKVRYFSNEHFKDCFVVSWQAQGIGLGEFAMYEKDGNFTVDTECMGREFCLALASEALNEVKEELKDKFRMMFAAIDWAVDWD